MAGCQGRGHDVTRKKICDILAYMDNSSDSVDKPTINSKNRAVRLLYLVGVAYLLLALLTPLVVIPKKFIFPFIFPKVIYLRVVITIAAACLLCTALWYKQIRYKFSKLHVAVIAYLCALGLSAVFGVDAHHSFWGGHERMLGLISVLHYALLLFLFPLAMRGWKGEELEHIKMFGWRTAWWVFMGVSVVVSIVAFAQRFGDGVLFNEGGGRVFSTLGNFIYLGNFMGVSFIAALLLLAHERRKIVRVFLMLMAAVSVLVLLYSGSRGALLGLLVGVAVTGTIVIARESSQLRRWGIRILTIIVVCSGLVWLTPLNGVVEKMPGIGRLANITSDSGPRIAAWQASVEAWKEKPMFGWGHENFYAAFNQHISPDALSNSYYETWFDNAHNVLFNILATGGALGILTYVAVYVAALMMLYRFKPQTREEKMRVYAAFALLLTDFFSKLFVFDTPISLITFFMTLAFIYDVTKKPETYTRKVEVVPAKKVGMSFIVIAIFALTVIFEINIKPSQANAATLRSLVLLHQQGPKNAKQIIKANFELQTPYISDLRLDVGRTVRELLPQWQQNYPREELKEIVGLTILGMEDAYRQHPNELHLGLIQIDLASFMLPDEEWRAFLDTRINEVIEKSPNRQQLYLLASTIYLKQRDVEKALEFANHAIEINPKVGRAYWTRGQIYFADGDTEKAWDDVRFALLEGLYMPEGPKKLDFASQLIEQNQFSDLRFINALISLYESVGQQVPPHIMLREARTYKNIGLHQIAYERAQRMEVLFPHDTDNFSDMLVKPQEPVTTEELYGLFQKYVLEKGEMWRYNLYEPLVFAAAFHNDTEKIDEIFAEMDKEIISDDRRRPYLECLVEHARTHSYPEGIHKQCTSYNSL